MFFFYVYKSKYKQRNNLQITMVEKYFLKVDMSETDETSGAVEEGREGEKGKISSSEKKPMWPMEKRKKYHNNSKN